MSGQWRACVKMSRSLVSRWIWVCSPRAYAPPMRKGIPESCRAIRARRYMVRTRSRSLRMFDAQRKLEFPVRRAFRRPSLEQGQRDVVDGDPVGSRAFGRPVVGVAVEHGVDAVAMDRLLQAAGAQERVDFRRLPEHRGADRRVVEQHDALAGLQ